MSVSCVMWMSPIFALLEDLSLTAHVRLLKEPKLYHWGATPFTGWLLMSPPHLSYCRVGYKSWLLCRAILKYQLIDWLISSKTMQNDVVRPSVDWPELCIKMFCVFLWIYSHVSLKFGGSPSIITLYWVRVALGDYL